MCDVLYPAKNVRFVGGYTINVFCNVVLGFYCCINRPDDYLQIALVCLCYISPVNESVQRNEILSIQL